MEMLIKILVFCTITKLSGLNALSCMENKESYLRRASEITCQSGEEYHCGMLTSGEVKEFCFLSSAMRPGVCPRFDIYLKKEITSVRCDGTECPNIPYVSSELYKYPVCFALPKTSIQLTTLYILSRTYGTHQNDKSDKNETHINTLEISIITPMAKEISSPSPSSPTLLIISIIAIGGVFIVALIIIMSTLLVCFIKSKVRALNTSMDQHETRNIELGKVTDDGYNTIGDIRSLHDTRGPEEKIERKISMKTKWSKNASDKSLMKRDTCGSVHKAEKEDTLEKFSDSENIPFEYLPSCGEKDVNCYDVPVVNKYETLQHVSPSDIPSEYRSLAGNTEDIQQRIGDT